MTFRESIASRLSAVRMHSRLTQRRASGRRACQITDCSPRTLAASLIAADCDDNSLNGRHGEQPRACRLHVNRMRTMAYETNTQKRQY